MKIKYLPVSCVSVICVFTFSEPVFAYIDPGTGSLIIQGFLAAIAGAFITIKFYWYKLKSFFTKSKPSDNDNPDNTEDN